MDRYLDYSWHCKDAGALKALEVLVATTDTATYAGAAAKVGTELSHGDDDCLKADRVEL